MKAILLDKSGDAENFRISEYNMPSINPAEVLVELKAISINPADAKMRSGGYRQLDFSSPVIMGWDMSGVVVQAGSEVTELKVGDRVFGMIRFPDLGHTYAEYVAAPADHLAVIPQNISFEQAAASTLAALTAYQTIVDKAKIEIGQRVLIHAASGGVGHFAIQLAKSLGAHVIGTSSPENRDFILGLGADQHVDYKGDELEKNISEVDFILDSLGKENLLRSIPLLKTGGRLLTILHGIDQEVTDKARDKAVDLLFHLVEPNQKDIKAIAELLANGTIKPHIFQVFPFEKMADAHKQIETGRTIGRVVISI